MAENRWKSELDLALAEAEQELAELDDGPWSTYKRGVRDGLALALQLLERMDDFDDEEVVGAPGASWGDSNAPEIYRSSADILRDDEAFVAVIEFVPDDDDAA